MKFNDGAWVLKPGVMNYNARQIRHTEISPDKRSVKFWAVSYRDDVRVLDGPDFSIEISSPKRDCIRFRMVHFKGVKQKRTGFDLSDDRLPMDICENGDEISITSGKTTLSVTRKAASFTYSYDGSPRTFIFRRPTGPFVGLLNTPEGPFLRCRLGVGVGEKIYGLGERFTPFVKNGQSIDIWNEDGGTSSEISYKNIPFYLSNRNYGVLVNDSGRVSYEVCTECVTAVQFSVPGQVLDFTLIGGSDRKDVLRTYTDLSGKPGLPPVWSFGLWLSTSFTTNYDERFVTEMVDGMKKRDIPLSVFHYDCFWMEEGKWCGFEWDPVTFPDPRKMLASLKKRGLRICVWINPYLGQRAGCFDECVRKGLLLKRPNGDVWQWDTWQPGLGIYDFTNPETVRWYQQKIMDLAEMGVDAFKTDFGERIPTDCVYFDGSDPYYMHNYYAYLYNRVVYEAVAKANGKGNACVFARSATVGTQAFPVVWGGDNYSNYPSMAESLRGGLSLCLSGFGFWSHDMGGFEGTADPDVYKRWLAFGLLSSHSRLHGNNSYRAPWLFDEESVEVCRFFAKLKNRLMPYLWSLACEAHTWGLPLMRPMMLEFDDRVCEDCDRQYMLGDALLVAPIFNSEGVGSFYLPEGIWTHLLSGKCLRGGGWKDEQYDYFSLPLFVRPGSVLPLGNCEDTPEYDYSKDLTLLLSYFSDGQMGRRCICGPDGSVLLRILAERKGDRVLLHLDRNVKGLKCVYMDREGPKQTFSALSDTEYVLSLS